MSAVLKPIERSVRKARRRLFGQLLVNRLAICTSIALLLGAIWVACEPLVIQSAAANLKWYVVGGLVATGVLASIVWAKLATPSPTNTALEVDTRFGLRERVTTVLGLGPIELATPAGQAVLADASAKLSKVAVGEKFPVRPRWHAALVPGLAACVALAAIYPIPVVQDLLAETSTGADDKKTDPTKVEKPQPKNPTPFTQRNKPPELATREDKSQELKDLEEQINQMMRKFDTDPNRETQEKLKEKVAELTAMQEKVQKFNQEKFERMQKLEQQLQQLDRLNKDQDFQDGPAKKLNDALSKGDLPDAKDQLDQLKKKLEEKKLTKEEQEQLSRQLEKMKEKLQQLDRNKEREKKLEEMIKKAKEEGREQDAESLDRELKQLQQEAKECAECSKQLAQNFQKAQEALKNGNVEEAAQELEKAAKNLQSVEGELQDLEDAEQYLQRLKSEKEGACKKCQGEGDGPPERKDYADGAGQASGLRPENKDAKTSSEDQRIRGLFDPRGKKTYGGSTKGQAFKKATTAELGPAIQQAAQDAPKATDSGRYSRDAKESVKEYFQNLGGQTPGGK